MAQGAQPKRIVILRALQLGDLMCAVPSFRRFRSAWPSARIALLGLPWARDFVQRFSLYVDEFIEFPGYPGLPERLADTEAIPPFLQAMRDRRFEWALQLHGDGSITNDLVRSFGARRVAGFHPAGQPAPSGGDFVEYRAERHEIRRLLVMADHLGAPAGSECLEFPIHRGEEMEWRRLRFENGLANCDYVCLHAGARAQARRWPVSEFARAGRALAERGLSVIVTGEGAEEGGLAADLVRALDGQALNLAGRTSLGVLAALIRDARLLVCNDTGVSHLAAAVRTPSVVIFRVTDPARWAPLDALLHRPVIDGPGAADRVLAHARDLLRREGAGAA